MNYTSIPYSIVENKDLDFTAVRKSVEKITKNIISGKALFNYSNQAIRIVPADVIRYVSQSLLLTKDNVYRSALVNFVLSCERNCTGSGILFLLLISNQLKVSGNQKTRLEKRDLEDVIKFYLGHGKIHKTVLNLFYTAGFEFESEYREGSVENLTVVCSDSVQIDGHIDPLFHGVSLDDSFIIVCIDGVVESLGEIDSLLQWSSSREKKAVLMARNFNPDVSNTLRKNWDTEALSVVPYCLSDDGFNSIEPVSKETVSSETGLRLSNIDFDSYDPMKVANSGVNRISISCGLIGSNSKKIDFILPTKLTSIHAVLEERLKFGIALTKNCLYKGTSYVNYRSAKIQVPALCLNYALRAVEEWKKIDDISCVITLEQKKCLSNL